MQKTRTSIIAVIIIAATVIFQCQCQCATAQSVKGVAFQPDTISGSAWLPNYDWQRPEVLAELSELKSKTDLTHIAVIVSAGQQFSYPVPSAGEISRFNLFLSDAGAAGFKVIPIIGTPCIISNNAVSAAGNPWGRVHIGGHKAGEVVNGWTLFWDTPFCGTDYSDVAISWYVAILSQVLHDNIGYISIAGDYRTPFASETNMFFAESPFRAEISSHISKLSVELKSTFPDLKISLSSTLSWWKTGSMVYDQAQYIAANVLPSVDFVEVASRYGIDLTQLLAYYPPQKVILTDMKMRYGFSPTPFSSVAWHLNQAELRGFYGWWIWEYRHYTSLEGSLRERNSAGGAWDEKLVTLIKAYTYMPNTPN